MNRRLAPRLAIVLALCAAVLVGMAFQDSAVTGWIRANAIRLTTPEAGHGFADMQPLKKLIGDARIVSLGEATHGSREFFQLKHRMLEFLASEMGFTVFSIEANMPEAYRVNDYVLHGTGDPAQLLRGMYFWTWDTEEVLAMIRWMREFNAEIDWAIQNARVVLQSLQMRANEVPRDRSMAENVKWTLDRNPRAKIVLWAHDGHVAAGGFSYETMGMALRRMTEPRW